MIIDLILHVSSTEDHSDIMNGLDPGKEFPLEYDHWMGEREGMLYEVIRILDENL